MTSTPINYIQRTKDWYLALGYDNPYQWAHFSEVPFTPLLKPLSECKVTLVTTAAPFQPDKGPQGVGAPYNAGAKFYEVYSKETALDHDLRISHVSIDRKHTSMEDPNTWFPLPALRRAVETKQIASLAPNFHGMPTNRSQKRTLELDSPEVVKRCKEEGVDAVVLVPNCPVCHQTISILARQLEAEKISTVIMGCAKDIVEYCGVPRFLFSDFPLGNSAGKPNDLQSQEYTLDLALNLLVSATQSRTTQVSSLSWSESDNWKIDYCNPNLLSQEQIALLRAENDSAKAIAKSIRN
jgi:hypothetical protein